MNRDLALDRIRTEAEWDFLVIGGGATGLGVAVDAASRGYRTLLVEGDDFAKGTSSRSTKLVHGGVRYLKQGNISLVKDALRERGYLAANAPHLVHPMEFVIPVYQGWEAPFYGIGLKLYDLLAGRLNLAPSRWLTRTETVQHLPTVEPRGLLGGISYHDGQFDDARLAIALARTASDLGAVVVNYVRAVGFDHQDGRLTGARLRDEESGEEYPVRARVVVNATGVFADTVRRLDDPSTPKMLSPSQGAHVVLPREFLPGNSALMVPRTPDDRVLFAVPWHGHVVVGTTDTPVDSIALEPRPLEKEIDFILETSGRYLSRKPHRSDVLSTFAGLRPLVSSGKAAKAGERTASLSRDHTLLVSESGLVTITGGKWTTYRKMAEQTVTQAAAVGGLTQRPCTTGDLRLHGWTRETPATPHLLGYGSDASAVCALAENESALAEPLHRELTVTGAEVVWAVRHEMARTVEDVLSRRTRSLLLHAHASIEAAPAVARLMARELGRDAYWEAEAVERFGLVAVGYLPR